MAADLSPPAGESDWEEQYLLTLGAAAERLDSEIAQIQGWLATSHDDVAVAAWHRRVQHLLDV